MLTKLRARFKVLFDGIAKYLVRLGVKPTHVTICGLILSLLAAVIAYITKNTLIPIALIVISAFSDALDGSIARLTSSMSPLGAFLDSVCDRVSDVAYALVMVFVHIDYVLVLLFMATSLLISYLRARAEALGIKMEGIGIMERAERWLVVVTSLVLVTFSLTNIANTVVGIALILNTVTIVQRGTEVWRRLKVGQPGSSP